MAEMTEIRVLNQNLEFDGIIDIYESFIWTERYNECGDFEIYTQMDPGILNTVQIGDYLEIPDSEYAMIVESVVLDHDYEQGNHITIKGRSLESILDRRVIWDHCVFSNVSLGSLIKTLIYNSIIAPTDSDRAISNFIFYEPIEIPNITLESVQFYGDNLYDVISGLCKANNIGYKIVIEGSNLVFYLYSGKNRSYEQDVNPYVVFSPEYDNVLNTNYINSIQVLKNVCLVLGEGYGNDRTAVKVNIEDAPTGINRREMCIDESISSTGQSSTDPYEKQLYEKGREALLSNQFIESYDAQINPRPIYIYGVDYHLGDIVQIVNDFGLGSTTRVSEYVRSYSTSGIDAYPTFIYDNEESSMESSTIHTSSGGSGGGGGTSTNDHNLLINRDMSNQHPITSVNNLRGELDTRPDTALSVEDIDLILT